MFWKNKISGFLGFKKLARKFYGSTLKKTLVFRRGFSEKKEKSFGQKFRRFSSSTNITTKIFPGSTLRKIKTERNFSHFVARFKVNEKNVLEKQNFWIFRVKKLARKSFTVRHSKKLKFFVAYYRKKRKIFRAKIS